MHLLSRLIFASTIILILFSLANRRSNGDEPLRTLASQLASDVTIPKRRTRSSAASTVASLTEDETDGLSLPSKIGSSTLKKGMTKAEISRASLSSVSTANDYATSSGYSTPATSAAATPAMTSKQENRSR